METTTLKEKIYVYPSMATIDPILKHHFKVGRKVIVTDGSYMIDADTKKGVSGVYFVKNGEFELLTITRINVPFKTDYSIDVLGYHNNCEIEGADGKRYYCSHINIQVFSKS